MTHIAIPLAKISGSNLRIYDFRKIDFRNSYHKKNDRRPNPNSHVAAIKKLTLLISKKVGGTNARFELGGNFDSGTT